MEEMSTLKYVSDMAGIADSYNSAWGEELQVGDETIRQLLKALGYDTSSDEALGLSAAKKHKKAILSPTQVVYVGKPVEVALNVGSSVRPSEFSWQLITEANETFEGLLQATLLRDEREQGGALLFTLPLELPLGYHKLRVNRKRRKTPYEMTLIVAPEACYKQPALNDGIKMWGPSIQLYSLRSQTNWGIGDFGDLKQLVSGIAERGGDFVGINPIHSLFPANPEEASPYSPSSRRWLNIFYIDVQAMPEFADCKAAQQLVFADDFQRRLKQARTHDWVQYGEVAALKMAVLPHLYQHFKQYHLERDSKRAREYRAFVKEGGAGLKAQAAFDALHAAFLAESDDIWGWQQFPVKYQRFDSPAVQAFIEQNSDQVELYLYLQWIADQQIGEVQAVAQEKGMQLGLYRDLAVGVASSGAECWADDGSLVQEMSIGAPPDVLGPQGQNWGLPPLNPQVLEATGYDAFIKLLRANMKHCGALRIDHVLGLLRLWWIPHDMTALQGTYIYYPVREMLAILALESHRHQCSIIGEDLGTVPEEISGLLQEAGIYSYKVFFFETSKTDGGYLSPAHYPEQSMSAICTHDMPTLRGYWHCGDLNLGRELGLYPNSNQLQRLFEARLKSKQGVLDSVAWHGHKPEGVGNDALYVPMDSYLAEALQVHMAAGSSALLSVQLEEWLEMDKPVNVPGTSTEYPNWRRKLSVDLDVMLARDSVNRIAYRLSDTRKAVSR